MFCCALLCVAVGYCELLCVVRCSALVHRLCLSRSPFSHVPCKLEEMPATAQKPLTGLDLGLSCHQQPSRLQQDLRSLTSLIETRDPSLWNTDLGAGNYKQIYGRLQNENSQHFGPEPPENKQKPQASMASAGLSRPRTWRKRKNAREVGRAGQNVSNQNPGDGHTCTMGKPLCRGYFFDRCWVISQNLGRYPANCHLGGSLHWVI